MNWFRRIDLAVYHWMRDREQPVVMYVARDLTSFGGNVGVFVATVFVCGLLGLAGEWVQSSRACAGVLLAGLIVYGLKVFIDRPCPLQPDPYQHDHWPLGFGNHPSLEQMRMIEEKRQREASKKCVTGGLERGASFPVPHLPCMPSGHTFGSVFLYGLLAHLAIQLWPEYTFWWTAWGIGLPIAVGCTRIILSAHWLTDVVAGFVLGHLLLAAWRFVA